MPPGRRKSTHPSSSSSSQRTLAFGPHPNKITKPNQPSITTLKKPSSPSSSSTTISLALPPAKKDPPSTPSPPPAPAPAPALAPVEEIKSPEAKLAIREPRVSKAVVAPKSEAEERAARVGDGEVRRYWRKQEAERKAPRGGEAFFLPLFWI